MLTPRSTSQNDLNEYFSLLNFCNPGYLGTKQQFHKEFEMPILRGRDGDATDKQKEKGDQAQKELLTKVNKFIIRRTNDLLSKYRTYSLSSLRRVVIVVVVDRADSSEFRFR